MPEELPAPDDSFLSLMEIHRDLDELFLLHQEALLTLDVALADERLHRYVTGLKEHMRAEEDLLLPVYERAGPIPGGAVALFVGEHRKMLEFLARFEVALAGMESESRGLKRDVLRLLDEEATFKHLMEHHDLREQNILYPTLDRVTNEDERRGLLRRCAGGTGA